MNRALSSPVLRGRSISCRVFSADGVHARYVEWLNDPEVNRYSRRRFVVTTEADARAFLDGLSPDECVLAIHTADHVHIGNIQYHIVDRQAAVAELRLLIGEREAWGRGYGTEALYLVSRDLFERLALNRVEANTCNPAFARAVEKLGWRLEGRLRERCLCDGRRLDYLWFGQLRSEFARRPDLDPVDGA